VAHDLASSLVGFSAVVVGAAVAWWMGPRRRIRDALAKPVSLDRRIEDLKDGDYARVVAAVKEGTHTDNAPVTNRPCIAYRVEIDERYDGDEAWWNVTCQTSCPPSLTLVDGDCELLVEGPFVLGLGYDEAGGAASNVAPGVFGVLAQAGVPTGGPFGRHRRFRYREAILRPGERVVVCGVATVAVSADGAREQRRGPPLHRSLRAWPGESVLISRAAADQI
jgi:hypothetical protein